MKSFLCGIILFLFITGCSKKQQQRVSDDGLVGKWKLTETFWSPGRAGSWHPVSLPDQYIIDFRETGKLSYSANFYMADSLFNRYSVAGDTILVSSTVNNKTDEWLYSYDGQELIINFNVRIMCIEGCASRFRAVNE